MGIEMREALQAMDADDDVRAVVVTGAGRDFCVGADLEGGGRVFDEARAAENEGAERLALKAWDIRKPVIAALNGAVAGVGATLPLQWDIRLAGESMRITFVFVKRGLVPEAASTWLLPRLIGMGRATELLLTGRLVPAREALEMGLVSRVVPDAELRGGGAGPGARDRRADRAGGGRAHQAAPLAHDQRAQRGGGGEARRSGVRVGDAVAGRQGRHPGVPGEAEGAVVDATRQRSARPGSLREALMETLGAFLDAAIGARPGARSVGLGGA